MVSIAKRDFKQRIEAVLNILIVNARVIFRHVVERSDPLGRANGPVFKGRRANGQRRREGRPAHDVALSRVIESILASTMAMNINQDVDVVFITQVQDPIEFFNRPLGAFNVGWVGFKHPVAHGNPEGVYAITREFRNVIFGDEFRPMESQLGICLLFTECRTKRGHVHAGFLRGLVSKSILGTYYE